MNKKNIIFIVIVTCILVLTVILYIYNNYSTKKSPATQDPSPNTNTGIPTGNINNNITDPNGVSTSQDLRTNTYYWKADSELQPDLKKTIDESLKNKTFEEEVNWESYATKSGKQITLNDFTNAIGIKIEPKLNTLLDQYNYDRIICKNSSGGFDYGFVLNNKIFNNQPTLKQDETKILKAWEQTMFKDLYNVLYPDTLISEKDLNQTLTFKNGKYRYAEITLSDDKILTLNYNILVDSIVFANSLECLDKASAEIEYIEE
jgi:hypothetical protein